MSQKWSFADSFEMNEVLKSQRTGDDSGGSSPTDLFEITLEEMLDKIGVSPEERLAMEKSIEHLDRFIIPEMI